MALAWADDTEAARLRIDHAPFGTYEVVTEEALALRHRVAPAASPDASPGDDSDRDAGAPVLQGMAGTFERIDDAILFTPRFVFVDGVRYVLLVDGQPAASLLRPAAPPPPPTTVTGIFPTGTTVPVNVLRLYLHFSAPMSEGFAARAIRLTDEKTGTPIADALLDFTHELWDPARTRLTVLFEPGRIKRGLVPHMEMGYPLVTNRPVVLHVDTAFKDAKGQPLEEGYSRRWQVGPPLVTRVDPALWQITRPAAGSTAGLLISFDRPLDRALAGRCLHVRDAEGLPLAGEAHLTAGERMWTFKPAQAWPAGAVLAVETRLEDVCGNSVLRPFDRDLTTEADTPAGDAAEITLDATAPTQR